MATREFKPPHGWHRANILLMGDSLTEMGTSTPNGWATILGQYYSRRADIINRGFGGYTTSVALAILPEVLETVDMRRTALALVWYGANDATNPDGAQAFMRVPVEAYAANLRRIVAGLKGAGVANVALVTPPPVDDAKRVATSDPNLPPDRKLAITAQYAAAVVEVGRALGVPVLNLFADIQAMAPNWSDRFMMADGLHFSEDGNAMVARAVNDFIWARVPSARTESLLFHHPSWEELDYSNYPAQLDAERRAAGAA